MVEKIYCLLIICGIFCFNQIITAETSDKLVRRKRVVNLEPGGDIPLQNGDAPYVVNIRKSSNNITICAGAILSKYTVLTIANCVASLDVSLIKVLSGSTYHHRGDQHDVIKKSIHIGDHQRTNGDGIALLSVKPAFIFDTRTGTIQLYHGLLLPGMLATIFGWGCNPRPESYGTNYRGRLRSITVPIMSHKDCVNIHRGHFLITENDICTYDANKRCGQTDAGAPLVIDNQLAGLHLWRVPLPNRVGPDVFVVLQSLEYGSWIRNNTLYKFGHIRGSK